MSEKLYKTIDVCARKNGVLVRYRCFQVLPDESYCVQSADYYRPPFDDAIHEKQFFELLAEEAPDTRSPQFPSLIDAIRAFDRDFNEETIHLEKQNLT